MILIGLLLSGPTLSSDSCVICLTEFDPHDETVLLPCNHIYHCTCLSHWIADHNDCPTCRNPINIVSNQARREAQIAELIEDFRKSKAYLGRKNLHSLCFGPILFAIWALSAGFPFRFPSSALTSSLFSIVTLVVLPPFKDFTIIYLHSTRSVASYCKYHKLKLCLWSMWIALSLAYFLSLLLSTPNNAIEQAEILIIMVQLMTHVYLCGETQCKISCFMRDLARLEHISYDMILPPERIGRFEEQLNVIYGNQIDGERFYNLMV